MLQNVRHHEIENPLKPIRGTTRPANRELAMQTSSRAFHTSKEGASSDLTRRAKANTTHTKRDCQYTTTNSHLDGVECDTLPSHYSWLDDATSPSSLKASDRIGIKKCYPYRRVLACQHTLISKITLGFSPIEKENQKEHNRTADQKKNQ